jgi:hypothetical protein
MYSLFGFALAAQVIAGAGGRIGMQRTHVQQAVDTVGATGLDHLIGQLDMRVIETFSVIVAFVENPDQVDYSVLISEVFVERGLVMDISFQQFHGGHDQQVAMLFTTAGQNTYSMALHDQTIDQMTSDEPCATEDANAPFHYSCPFCRFVMTMF